VTGESTRQPVDVGTLSSGYVPHLDGLRAVSVVLVLLGHFGFGHIIPATFGVTIFFVISGFIITRLFLLEIERTGTLSLRQFYTRRVFRVFPALLSLVVVSAIFFDNAWPDIVASILFLFNYFNIFFIERPDRALDLLGVLWSLAVEEHFYLFFPLLVFFWRRSIRSLVWVLTSDTRRR
jgi:peptidoglycan/LPS O-acetylase OafA/YrhL